MKQRRGRRGFWWWSWLLALITIGMTVGGFLYGKKRWEETPKDYIAKAVVSVDIREPFSKRGVPQIETGLLNANETEIIRGIESSEGLTPVINDLDLAKRWELGMNDALVELKSSLDLELEEDGKELTVKLTRHSPEESAEIANAIARAIPARIQALDKTKISESEKKLADEIEPMKQAAEDARLAVKKALADIGAPIDPVPGMDLSVYLADPSVAGAHLEWDAALEDLASSESGQRDFALYLKKEISPSVLSTIAVPPTRISGPELRPIQMQTALYGLTLGLLAGVLMMAICWKLFS